MKIPLLSLLIIFSNINVFAHGYYRPLYRTECTGVKKSEPSKIEDFHCERTILTRSPELFEYSEKTCNAEFILFWLNDRDSQNRYSIAEAVNKFLCEDLKSDPDINLAIVKISHNIIKIMDPKFITYVRREAGS